MATVTVHEVELLMIYYLCQTAGKAILAIEDNPTGVPKSLARSAARFADRAEHIAQYALPGRPREEVRLRCLGEDYAELAGVLSGMRAALSSSYLMLPTEDDLERVAEKLRAAGVAV